MEYDGDMESEEFLINLENYVDEINSISESELNLHFTYNIDFSNRIHVYPDYFLEEYIGGMFE